MCREYNRADTDCKRRGEKDQRDRGRAVEREERDRRRLEALHAKRCLLLCLCLCLCLCLGLPEHVVHNNAAACFTRQMQQGKVPRSVSCWSGALADSKHAVLAPVLVQHYLQCVRLARWL